MTEWKKVFSAQRINTQKIQRVALNYENAKHPRRKLARMYSLQESTGQCAQDWMLDLTEGQGNKQKRTRSPPWELQEVKPPRYPVLVRVGDLRIGL